MTTEQQQGYLGCLTNLERTLPDLQRAAVITGLGLNTVTSMGTLARHLRQQVSGAEIPPAGRIASNSESMRPSRGD